VIKVALSPRVLKVKIDRQKVLGFVFVQRILNANFPDTFILMTDGSPYLAQVGFFDLKWVPVNCLRSLGSGYSQSRISILDPVLSNNTMSARMLV
jgi:hypothetical protein